MDDEETAAVDVDEDAPAASDRAVLIQQRIAAEAARITAARQKRRLELTPKVRSR